MQKQYGIWNEHDGEWWLDAKKQVLTFMTEEAAQVHFDTAKAADPELKSWEHYTREYEAKEALTIERAATASVYGEKPAYSPYGYIIMRDGTVYSLNKQCFHGVVLAILFPEFLEGRPGPVGPVDEVPVFRWQRYELDNQEKFDAIRVSFRLLSDAFNVSGGTKPCSPEQIASLQAVANAHDVNGQTQIQTGAFKTMKFNVLISELTKGKALHEFE